MGHLTIGVTGHRHLPDTAALARVVDDTLARLAGAEEHMVVLTALAEGADRLVARRARQRSGTQLVAVLPLAVDDYEDDFADPSSISEFGDLLAAAGRVVQMEPAASREDAYLAAGTYVVDQSDVLLALWDGAPPRGKGGTAEVVSYARAKEHPVAWIEPAHLTVTYERWPPP